MSKSISIAQLLGVSLIGFTLGAALGILFAPDKRGNLRRRQLAYAGQKGDSRLTFDDFLDELRQLEAGAATRDKTMVASNR